MKDCHTVYLLQFSKEELCPKINTKCLLRLSKKHSVVPLELKLKDQPVCLGSSSTDSVNSVNNSQHRLLSKTAKPTHLQEQQLNWFWFCIKIAILLCHRSGSTQFSYKTNHIKKNLKSPRS